jgi:hypothetical protein
MLLRQSFAELFGTIDPTRIGGDNDRID